MTIDAIATLTNLTRRADDAFTRAIATSESRSVVGRLATSSIGAGIRIALIFDAYRRSSSRVADLIHCARRIARRDANAIHTRLTRRARRASARRDAREAHEGVIGNASLIGWTRIGFARIVHARALIADFSATLARHVVTIVEHALASIRTGWRAHRTCAAGDARARIAATGGAIAFANRWFDATRQFRTGGSAQHGVVRILDGLRRTIAAKSVEVRRAIRHGQRISRFAAHDHFALLSRWTGEFARIAGSCALTAARALDANLALRAARIRAVIDDAIAIVVRAIAFFDRRALPTETNEDAIFTGPRALHANALVLATRLANDGHRRRKRVGRSIQTIGRIADFIDRAVAIVVEAIANFGIRAYATDANEATGAVALQHTRLTRSARPIPRIKNGIVCRHAAAAERNTIVDVAFAIVIEAVARLGSRRNVAGTIENTRGAGNHAFLAFTDVRTAFTTNTGQGSIIGHAIAVVIEAITRFRCGPLGILTNPPGCSSTSQRAEIARSRQGSISRAGRALRRAPIQSIKRTAIAWFVPAAILTSRRSIGKRRVVRRAVAVVINAVANFILRTDTALTNQ